MKDGVPPNDYFARGSVLRSQLSTHGVIHTDTDVDQHFARNLTPNYSVQNSILLAKEDLSRKAVLKHVAIWQ